MRFLGREFGRSKQPTTGQAEPTIEGGLPIVREKAARVINSPSGPWMPIVRESYGGAWQQNVEVNQTAVLAFHAVFSCMTLIASDISKLRVKLVQQDEHGIWAETTRPAYSPVLRKPNGFQTRIQFFEAWFLSKLSSGNTYILKRRDARNVVTALYVLDPHRVRPLIADDGSIFYELQQDDISEITGPMVVPARELIHDRFNCLFHPLVGISPIYANGLAATQGLRIQDNSAVFFGNQSRPGGLLSAPGKISPESAAELKANWYEYYGGKNSGRVAVLGDGLKYEHMAVTAKDAELIDQLKWTAEVVCSTFHVPPYKLGIGNMPTNSNVESLNLEYYTQALQSLIEAAELCLDEGLGIGESFGIGTEFDLDGLLRMEEALNSLSSLIARLFSRVDTGSGGSSGGILGTLGKVFGLIRGGGGLSGGITAPNFSPIPILPDTSGLPRFATGGSFKVGGMSGIDANVVSMRLTKGEMVDIRKPGNDNAAGGRWVIEPSPWFDVRAADAARPETQAMGVKAAAGGAQIAQGKAARTARRRLGR